MVRSGLTGAMATDRFCAVSITVWILASALLIANAFDVASIKPGTTARASGEGSRRDLAEATPTGINFYNTSLSRCIQRAYDVKSFQIAGPDWVVQDRYDIMAKTEEPVAKERTAGKLPHSEADHGSPSHVLDGSFVFQHVTMAEFAERLSGLAAIDRAVLDNTHIEGTFDITMKSAARAMLEDPSTIFSAVENTGLKLEARKGPFDVLVVDHADRPTSN